MEKAHKRLSGMALAFSLLIPAPAWAAGSVLGGVFDGTEASTVRLLHTDSCANTPSRYQQSTFEVSASGTYQFYDALGALHPFDGVGGLDVIVLVYERSFNASNPRQNLIGSGGVYEHGVDEVNLSAQTPYVLVVQLACRPHIEGAWAVTFSGPGTISSAHALAVTSFTSGAFSESDPLVDNSELFNLAVGGNYHYQQSGPLQVSRDALYYFSGAGLCLLVYTSPINPGDPKANLVAARWWSGTVNLMAGQDYYLVAQQCDSNGTSADYDYVYVLAPPAPFRINAALTDGWYNPETPGQGFFLDVYEQLNQIFLGWFTFSGDSATGGDAGHRWMTALGPFAGATSELAIEWNGGGRFDAADPVPERHEDGTIGLEFTDCTSGQVTYSWGGGASGSPLVSGVIPIQRIANDSVALCESLNAGPGMPGPL